MKREKQLSGRRIGAVILCCALLLGGCGRQEKEAAPEAEAAEEADGQTASGESTGKEGAAAQEGTDSPDGSGEDAGTGDGESFGGQETSADGQSSPAQAGQGAVVIEMGPDKKVWAEGSMVCTLRGFTLYDSPEQASIDETSLRTEDAGSYMDMPDGSRSRFLLVQAELDNLDYPGDEDGSLNVSMFTIVPAQAQEMDWWGCSYPVYVSDGGKGETDYYHVPVNMGESRTITLGFYVPVKDGQELRTRCRVGLYGNPDDEYMYQIPE